MKKYFKYFWHVLKHKWFVFCECMATGQYLHAFTHDLSKFLPDEFFPYANWFGGVNGIRISKWVDNHEDKEYYRCTGDANVLKEHDELNAKFKQAWEKHKRRNCHHWNCPRWKIELTVGADFDNGNSFHDTILVYTMPEKYVRQMIADWTAMGATGKPVSQWYIENKEKMDVCGDTTDIIEKLLRVG